jgi:hypothetical protein
MPGWAWLLIGIVLGILGAVLWIWLSLIKWGQDSW